MTKTPRGIRNCNPMNIRKSSSDWLGKVIPSLDQEFETFCDMEHGIRAAMKLIHTYITKHECTKLRDIIRRWAPQNENDTETYIRVVTMRSGIQPSDTIDPTNKAQMCRLTKAMTFVECGVSLELSLFETSYNLYIKSL